MHAKPPILALAVVAALALGCGGAPPPRTAASPPAAVLEPHLFVAADGTEVPADLGSLVVPLDRSRPGSGTLTLRFVRFPATGSAPGSPIVYLAGGPGGSGIDAARGSRLPLFLALREHGDVIAFDQRGTGLSEPDLDCDTPFQLPIDEPLDRERATDALAEAVRSCAAALDAADEVAALDTAESAADLEDLRRALGAPALTLWGISYGTHLALATARAYPGSVDRMILAGVEPLDRTLKLPSDQQALLEEIGRRAAADPALDGRVPDLVGSLRRLVAGLEAEPRGAQLVHPTTGSPVEVRVGADDLRLAAAGLLRGPESFRLLPDLVARLEAGDWTALALITGRERMGEAPNLMSVAMDCASGTGPEWRERIAREAADAVLGDAINFPFPGICAGLEVPDLGEAFRRPVVSEVPTLLISGTLDGRTPPTNAEAVARHLSRSAHLVLEGAGHSDPLFLSTPEILDTMHAFLRGDEVGDRRIEVPVPGFVPVRDPVALDAGTLARYQGAYRIAEDDQRLVVAAGPLLFTMRNGGPPFPLRPVSATEFFYEGTPSSVTFELDESGSPVAMTYFIEPGAEGERASRVDG